MFENIKLEIDRVRDGRVHYLLKSKKIDFPIRLQA